jgi:hypothetical protein
VGISDDLDLEVSAYTEEKKEEKKKERKRN